MGGRRSFLVQPELPVCHHSPTFDHEEEFLSIERLHLTASALYRQIIAETSDTELWSPCRVSVFEPRISLSYAKVPSRYNEAMLLSQAFQWLEAMGKLAEKPDRLEIGELIKIDQTPRKTGNQPTVAIFTKDR